jgi:ankyrin repeat protein
MISKIADGRTDLVMDYVEENQNPLATDKQGTSLIKWCAYYGDVSAVKYLISKGASLSDLGENLDLNGASFHGHWQLCQYLLEQGADANHALPDTGETPLHACLCKANNPVSHFIVKLLLAHGADPNVQTKPGQETGGFMRDVNTKGETPLHRAAAFGDTYCIRMLLEAGADKTKKDVHGDSPLTWASWHLRPGKILALLAYGNHRIHPLHEERMLSDHGAGWGGGVSLNQMGKVHI